MKNTKHIRNIFFLTILSFSLFWSFDCASAAENIHSDGKEIADTNKPLKDGSKTEKSEHFVISEKNDEPSTLMKCLAAVDFFNKKASTNSSQEIFKNWLIGQTFILKFSTEPPPLITSSETDLKYCAEFLDHNDFTFLLKVTKGYIDENDMKKIPACFAVILAAEDAVGKKFGSKAGEAFGAYLGKFLGGRVSVLTYLTNKDLFSDLSSPIAQEEVNTRLAWVMNKAKEILKNMPLMDNTKRAILLEKYGNLCEWYDVPVRSSLDAIDAVYQEPSQPPPNSKEK
ncbi:MAG: hypothetical protein AB7S81_03815 [Bdellovibrionales bacterium]